MEEEKVIWSAKEKASVEAIEEKSKSYNAELMLLSNEIVEVKFKQICNNCQRIGDYFLV